jgi:hypothetical protein
VGISDGGCNRTILDAFTGKPSLASVQTLALRPRAPASNAPPSIEIGPHEATVLEGEEILVPVSASDPGGDWTTLVGPYTVSCQTEFSDVLHAVVRYRPRSDEAGVHRFVLTATDILGQTATRELVVTVLDNPSAPTIRSFKTGRNRTTVTGSGFKPGALLVIRGNGYSDGKVTPTRITSRDARGDAQYPGNVVYVVNPDGSTSNLVLTK